MSKPMTPDELANLTDDQLMSMATAPEFAPVSAAETTTDTAEVTETVETTSTTEGADTTTVDDDEGEDTTTTTTEEEDGGTTENTQAGKTTEDGGNVAANVEEQLGADGKPVQKAPAQQEKPNGQDKTTTTAAPDYKAFYETALAPIKANGKTYELKSPDDLRALAQQGLNYTQKMQQIAPVRKIGMMLQDHGLLDEGKLSFLIDLHNKKPEAIRQLIKDAGIDPLEIDVTTDSQYTPSNHGVGEDEANFRTVLEDMKSSQAGQETLNLIHSTWDNGSKAALASNPSIMSIIAEQRSNGIYDRVAAEVDRRRALGQVPQNVTFLNAYQAVGQEMGQAGLLNDLIQPTPAVVAAAKTEAVVERQPIATRTVTKKPDPNAQKVAAAAATKTGGKTGVTTKNPLEMSDAEFEGELLKQRGYP